MEKKLKKRPLPRRRAPKGDALTLKKADYLLALQEHLTLENAAQAVGVSRREVFNWRQDDPEFEKLVQEYKSIAIDRLVDKAYEVALNQHGKYYEKDALLNRMFLIKARYPEFKEGFRPEIGVREVVFTFEIPRPAGMTALPEHVIEGEVTSGDS